MALKDINNGFCGHVGLGSTSVNPRGTTIIQHCCTTFYTYSLTYKKISSRAMTAANGNTILTIPAPGQFALEQRPYPSLTAGYAIIETENAGKNYPGVYSLWLKKVGGGWNLVFNSESDIWGTMRKPSKDVAEIPLVLTKLSEEESRFVVDLEEEGDGGVLRLAWGPNEWKTKFSVVR